MGETLCQHLRHHAGPLMSQKTVQFIAALWGSIAADNDRVYT